MQFIKAFSVSAIGAAVAIGSACAQGAPNCLGWMQSRGISVDHNALQVALRSKGRSGIFNARVQQIDGTVLTLFDEGTEAIGFADVKAAQVFDEARITVGAYVLGYGRQVNTTQVLRASGEAATAAVLQAGCISLSPSENLLSTAVALGASQTTPSAKATPPHLAQQSAPKTGESSGDPCTQEGACAAADEARADTELNRVYKDVMNKLEQPAKNKLRLEQRAWIKVRDNECAGSNFASANAISVCLAAVTNDRIAVLRRLK